MTLTQPYRAVAPAALLLAFPAAIFAVTCFIAIDRHSHSVSDTLYGIYPFWGTTFLIWDWLVRRVAEAKS
ncbi:MAG TPA: hypothetical protein VLM18_06840 [Croceibacterium sp.]|nr:hypothetical protein [Croceibacterium sp.]